MAQPPAYNRTKDFGADYPDQTDNQAINTELDAVASSINGIRTNLSKIQRDDGGLRDGIVTKESLASSLKDDLYNEFSGNINDSVLAAQQAAADATNAALAANGDAATAVSARNEAVTAAGAAQASAASASGSQSAAFGSASSAAASASTASGSASTAGTAATTATNAATAAVQARNEAVPAAATATTKAAEALASANAAAADANSAEQWATKTDGPVEGGQYSSKYWAMMTAAAQKWATRGIGEIVTIWDHLPGADAPPNNDPAFRYIKLTASDPYNAGVLASETVSGSAPLLLATAVINLPASPFHGATVDLVNTTRRVFRGGSSGTAEQDSFQGFRSGIPGGPLGVLLINTSVLNPGGLSIAALRNDVVTIAGLYNDGINGNPRVAFETRAKSIGATAYMRIL
ncbi:hypothetical protein D3C71_768360 [compost metagenome]